MNPNTLKRLLITLNIVLFALFVTFLTLYILKNNGTSYKSIAIVSEGDSHTQTPNGWTSMVLPKNDLPINQMCPSCTSYEYTQDSKTLKALVNESHLNPLEEQAKANFILTRNTYQGKEAPTNPFLSIITRSCGRITELQRNMNAVRDLIGNDFEHILLNDQVKAGMKVAETALCAFASEFRGDYICHCDDDDYISNSYMVEELKSLVQTAEHQFGHRPKVIIFKIYHSPWKQIMPSVWHTFPQEGQICTNCVAIRQDIYQNRENIGVVAQQHAGDWSFIANCLRECTEPGDLIWLDRTYMVVSKDMNEWSQRHQSQDLLTVQLNGGLGNQLFQVAVGINEAKKSGRLLVMDHTLQQVSPDSLKPRPTYFKNMFAFTKHEPELLQQLYFHPLKEKRFVYDPIPTVFAGHIMLDGFFQSSKYFSEQKEWILEQYRQALEKYVQTKKEQENVSSGYDLPHSECKHRVFVHVRRQDYIANQLHTDLSSMTYYEASFQKLQELIPDEPICFYVFSDDIHWCTNEAHWTLRPHDQIQFINHKDELISIYLMSQCSHAILANSSFSWWARVLSTYNEMDTTKYFTVAPKQWFFTNNPLDINDWSTIYEPHWFLI
jgi:hypothetical protein